MMDLQEKALAVFTVFGIVLAFGYFHVQLGALAGLASVPFLVMVILQ